MTIFIPHLADEGNTNAQNLTIRQIMARLDPQRFKVAANLITMPDTLLSGKANLSYFQWKKHFNTVRFLSYLLKTKPDILFFPNKSWFEVEFLLLRAAKLIKTKLITYLVHEINDHHRVTVNRSIPNLILKQLVASSSALVGNSDHVARGIQDVFGQDALVITDGIDDRYFFADPDAEKDANVNSRHARPLMVLYAGSFQGNKRPEVVVNIAAKHPGILFCLAGEGVERVACEQRTQDLGCVNVEFLGHLSQSQLGQAMRRADIFLFPSLSEGHPQVLGQAAACGLPSIAMSTYNPHYVKHGETGFLAKNDTEFDHFFHLLAHHKGMRQIMSQAAIRHAASFNWDDITAQWTHLFEQVMTNG